jgi:hypothetical protein
MRASMNNTAKRQRFLLEIDRPGAFSLVAVDSNFECDSLAFEAQ